MQPPALSLPVFFTDHDSEAPAVGGVEGLEAWAETVESRHQQDGKKHATLCPWAAHSGQKCMGGYRDQTETASQTPSPGNAPKLTQWP